MFDCMTASGGHFAYPRKMQCVYESCVVGHPNCAFESKRIGHLLLFHMKCAAVA